MSTVRILAVCAWVLALAHPLPLFAAPYDAIIHGGSLAVRKGQSAPGTGTGVFNTFGRPSLDSAGAAVFRAT
jgi:hypothetical protein